MSRPRDAGAKQRLSRGGVRSGRRRQELAGAALRQGHLPRGLHTHHRGHLPTGDTFDPSHRRRDDHSRRIIGLSCFLLLLHDARGVYRVP